MADGRVRDRGEGFLEEKDWPPMLKQIMDMSETCFKMMGYLIGTIFAVIGEKRIAIAVPQLTNGMKDTVEAIMIDMAGKGATELLWASESWGLKMPSEADLEFAKHNSLEDHKNRVELITISYETPSKTMMASREIFRKGDKVWLDIEGWKVMQMGTEGRFANFFKKSQAQSN